MLLRKGPRLRRLAVLGVALHALFLATAPFGHHDLICHLKTPQHCTSCATSPLSSDPRTPAAPGACTLSDAGRAVSIELASESALLPVRSTGRSPPQSA